MHYDKLNQNCRKFSELDFQGVWECKLQGVVCVFLLKKIGATGCSFDFQGVGKCKLQGVVCVFY